MRIEFARSGISTNLRIGAAFDLLSASKTDRHRIVDAAIFDEAESHFGTPATIAIDFFKCRAPCAAARSLAANGRSLPSAVGSAAFVVGRRARPLEATRSTACRLQWSVNDRRDVLPSTPPGSLSLLQVSINLEEVQKQSADTSQYRFIHQAEGVARSAPI